MSRRPLRLATPEPVQDAPTFFDGSPEGLTAWLDGLPIRNPVHLANALFKALVELDRCRTDVPLRFRQLEAIRPWVHVACATVARTRVDRPLLLAEQDRKIAALLQRTQFQLALGYRICIVDALRGGVVLRPGAAPESEAALVTVAIHRCIEELAQTLLRSVQCYVPPPKRLWAQLHDLFALAERARVQDEVVHDPERELAKDTRIGDAYERPLLLAAAKPNMLRHDRLGTLFTALEDWSRLVEVVPAAADATPVILVDLASDAPPAAAAGYRGTAASETRAVDTTRLVAQLNARLAGDPGGEIADHPVQDDLLRHVVQVWGELTDRAHERTPASGVVDLCVGLADVHFRAGDDRGLVEQLRSRRIGRGEDAVEEDLDPFAGASDVGGARNLLTASTGARPTPELPVEDGTDHPIHELALADRSPGGYGLVCRSAAPESLQAGELIGIRSEDASDWEIAVVRWLANDGGVGRLGTELLAARGETAGARPIASRAGESEWLRALLLPGAEALGEADVLVAPPECFSPGQKVALNFSGQQTKFTILERLERAPGFERFSVRELGAGRDAANATGIEVEDVSAEDEAALLEAFGLERD